MCGISGFFSENPLSAAEFDRIRTKTLNIQYRRGPDDFGYFISEERTLGLFHNRLSLVDLTSRGHQPMGKHGIVLTFNGEIYNFRQLKTELEDLGYVFFSRTDSEVILSAYHAWDMDCFSKFNGAFAIAIYDARSEKLVIARDRIGEKPLYYYHDKSKKIFSFASTIELLLHISGGSGLNKDRIVSDLVFNFWGDKRLTHFQNIYSLEPGHIIVINPALDPIKITKYWDLLPVEQSTKEQEVIFALDSLVNDATQLRVQLDTEIGAILSGGIDSSLITTLAQQQLAYKLKCFTLEKFGHLDEDLAAAQRLCPNNGWFHHKVQIRDIDLSLEKFQSITCAMEEPLLDQVYIYINRNYEEAHKQGLKAVINGQGADEIFLGYLDYYSFMRNSKSYESPQSFRDFWYNQFALRDYISKDQVMEVIDANIARNFQPYLTDDLLNSLIRFGIKTHMPALLIQEDKQSLNWSVECRTVYTDYRIVEYVNRIPSTLKCLDGKEKYLLRKIASKYLPDFITKRKKLGFPDLPDGRDKLIADLVDQGYLNRSGLLHDLFNEKLFDDLNKLPNSTKWKLCSVAILENVYFDIPL